jgi:putative autotransporter adhesin-like protein
MRTSLLIAAVLAIGASPASAADRNFGVSGFTKIRVDGPYTVTLTTGVAPFARATGSSTALDRVAINVNGETLVVRPATASWGGYPGADAGPVQIEIGVHELNNAALNGAGSLSISSVKGLNFALAVQGAGDVSVGSVESDNTTVTLVGSANVKLSGKTRKLVALVRGMSTLDAAALQTNDANIGAEGSTTIDANIANSAKIDATGNATIRVAGGPSCTTKAAGSSTISGCKSSN